MSFRGHPVRVLIIPGLHGSGPAHWQTWLQSHCRQSVRVEQDDWSTPDLDAWSARIGETLAREPAGQWVAVAHSFGCLALARHLVDRLATRAANADAAHAACGIAGALFVAPADPARFALDAALPRQALQLPGTMLASDTDPWMRADDARAWARDWSLGYVSLGDAGHINAESGFGPLPAAKHLTQFLIQRIEQSRRLSRAHVRELSFAV